MIIVDANVSTTEQKLGLQHDDLRPAYDVSVDQTDARSEWAAGKGVSLRAAPLRTLRAPGPCGTHSAPLHAGTSG
jgi:hypothetical protein